MGATLDRDTILDSFDSEAVTVEHGEDIVIVTDGTLC